MGKKGLGLIKIGVLKKLKKSVGFFFIWVRSSQFVKTNCTEIRSEKVSLFFKFVVYLTQFGPECDNPVVLINLPRCAYSHFKPQFCKHCCMSYLVCLSFFLWLNVNSSPSNWDVFFGSIVYQIGPKWNKSGSFSNKSQYIWLDELKSKYWNLIWKSHGFVQFGVQSDPLWSQTYHPCVHPSLI